MKKHEVKLYWKDEPNDIISRFIIEIEGDECIEEVEQSPIDDEVFYYITEPDEMAYLLNPENNEEFVVTKVVSTE